MKKIVLTGPESSGKTTLAIQLAIHYQTRWVPEYARYYLNHLNRDYDQGDLSKMGKGQLKVEESQVRLAKNYLFCDTDLVTIYIWSKVKYGRVDPWIEQMVENRSHEHYFLCKPDLPWVPDPQREHPNDRHLLYEKYEALLYRLKKSYSVIKGKDRLTQAIQFCHLLE